MKFENPPILFALILLLPPLLNARRRFSRRLPGFLRFVGRSASMDRETLVRDLRDRHTLSSLCFLFSIAALILALAGPRWGERSAVEYRRGLDVTFALDLSRSMDANDGSPTRLASAVRLARKTVDACPAFRFAVVLGNGSGVLAVPLTDDDESVLSLLSSVTSSSMTSAGTDLESLLDAALASFPSSSAARKLVVLLSDGEALSGSLPAAVDRALEGGAVIASVAFGSSAGSFLPLAAKQKGSERILSSRREQGLRDAASRTGGIFLDGDARETADRLATFIEGLASTGAAALTRRESVSRRAEFIFLALLLFGVSKYAESGSRKVAPRRKP